MLLVDELKLSFRSALMSRIVKAFPHTKGSTIAASWLLRLLPLSPRVDLKIGEKSFSLDLRYRSQLAAIKEWPPESDEISFVISKLQTGGVFFDLGSNWGLYTAVASSLVGADGLVVAVEFNPVPFGRLLKLVNSSVTNVLPLNLALSDISGQEIGVYNPWYRNDTGGFMLPDGKHRVRTRSLDDLWKQLGCPSVDMAKLDVEGFEPRVIAGGKTFFSEGVSAFLLIEVSEWTQTRTGISYTQIYHDLEDCGFSRAYQFVAGKLTEISRDADPLPVNKNILFSKREI